MSNFTTFIKRIKNIEKILLPHFSSAKCKPDKFSEISKALLSELDLANEFDLDSFFEYVIKQKDHPDIHHYDRNSTDNILFTVTRNKHFFIEIYSWATHTEIHSHNFSGGFKVLYGEYSQSKYQFVQTRKGVDWAQGDLKLMQTESLPLNKAHSILSGERFIHQVFHNKYPSVTLCIRTPDTKEDYFSYFYPGLRLSNTFFNRPQILQIKAFNQSCLTSGKFSRVLAEKLIANLPISKLMYDYFSISSYLTSKEDIRCKFEKELEKFVKNKFRIDLKTIRKQHQIHSLKIQMSSS